MTAPRPCSLSLPPSPFRQLTARAASLPLAVMYTRVLLLRSKTQPPFFFSPGFVLENGVHTARCVNFLNVHVRWPAQCCVRTLSLPCHFVCCLCCVVVVVARCAERPEPQLLARPRVSTLFLLRSSRACVSAPAVFPEHHRPSSRCTSASAAHCTRLEPVEGTSQWGRHGRAPPLPRHGTRNDRR